MQAHVIGDATGRGEAAFEALLAAMAEAPPAYFQVREKSSTDRELCARAARVRAALDAATAVLVNGRPDVAVAAGAQGVQLPADGLPLADVRRAFPRPFLVGVSCHALDELRWAAHEGADFAVLAPIYAPRGKPGVPLGPEVLDALAPPLPLFALGGMTVERVAAWPEARRRKLAGVAGIGLFHERGAEAVRALEALGA
jgi:thiamine-phosphate pyrophosphorylase